MIKVKKIQEKDNKFFLIERYYKEEQFSEFIVCENYDFETNTYKKGIKSSKLIDAYTDYNNLISDYPHFTKMVQYLEDREKKKLDKAIKKEKKLNEEIIKIY